MKVNKMQKQRHRNMLETMVALATSFMPASRRSGAMMAGDYLTPIIRSSYQPPHSIRGRIKHAGETRSIKRHQRRRAYLRR